MTTINVPTTAEEARPAVTGCGYSGCEVLCADPACPNAQDEMTTIKMTGYVPHGAEEGSGNLYELEIDGATFTHEVWVTRNTSGTDTYDEQRSPVDLDELYGEGTHEAVTRLVERFDKLVAEAWESHSVHLVTEAAIKDALMRAPVAEVTRENIRCEALAQALWERHGEERIAGWDDLSDETRGRWLTEARELITLLDEQD